MNGRALLARPAIILERGHRSVPLNGGALPTAAAGRRRRDIRPPAPMNAD